jgi:FAD:protein FMN transferase
MSLCSREIEIRRCRPLLGAFVEVSASGLSETELQSAINAAFAAIERIQRLMSAHDPASELSRLNREAACCRVPVSRETFEVLRRARQLATESGGAFDFAIAPTLADWGMLPSSLRRRSPGGWRDVRLLRGRRVRFLRPLALDLGGIAKGFAVDKAVETLRKHGVVSAIVNAGGDLRAFGPEPSVIHLRHPGSPQSLACKLRLQDAALATSSPCFTERHFHGRRISHLVQPAGRTAITGAISVSVRAGECWLADALTKVVLNSPERAETSLANHDAEAFVITA